MLFAVPLLLDDDGVVDGYQGGQGTSFSAPIVAAGAAWVAAKRPGLDNTQLTEPVRSNAVDLGEPGWDQTFGYGRFDLPRALSARSPGIDPLEPNDDVDWINGTYFHPDPPIYRGRRRVISGRVDELEDPADTYRVVLGGRRAVRLSAKRDFGDPVLEAYSGRAKTVFGNRGLIARSDKRGRRTETLEIVNRSRRRSSFFVVLSTRRTLDAGYRLTLSPAR